MIKKIKEIDNCYFIKIDCFFFLFFLFFLFIFFTRNEKEEFKNFKNRKRKIQFISGRIVGKFCVSQYFGREKLRYKEIKIKREQKGNAYCFLKNKKIYLSISHTDGISVATCGNSKFIGIDVEKKNKNIKKIAKKFLSKEEIEKTKGIPLITLWCVKEAVAKALGTGFVFSPKDIFIQNIDGEKFKIKLKGEFLSLFPEFENKGIEVKTFKKYNYIFAFCNIGDNTNTFHLKK